MEDLFEQVRKYEKKFTITRPFFLAWKKKENISSDRVTLLSLIISYEIQIQCHVLILLQIYLKILWNIRSVYLQFYPVLLLEPYEHHYPCLVSLSFPGMSICLFQGLSVYFEVCLSACFDVCLSIYLSVVFDVYLSVFFEVYLSVYFEAYLSVFIYCII
jgi:hypothetical protein